MTKAKNKFLCGLLALLIIPLSFIFISCGNGAEVKSISLEGKTYVCDNVEVVFVSGISDSKVKQIAENYEITDYTSIADLKNEIITEVTSSILAGDFDKTTFIFGKTTVAMSGSETEGIYTLENGKVEIRETAEAEVFMTLEVVDEQTICMTASDNPNTLGKKVCEGLIAKVYFKAFSLEGKTYACDNVEVSFVSGISDSKVKQIAENFDIAYDDETSIDDLKNEIITEVTNSILAGDFDKTTFIFGKTTVAMSGSETEGIYTLENGKVEIRETAEAEVFMTLEVVDEQTICMTASDNPKTLGKKVCEGLIAKVYFNLK